MTAAQVLTAAQMRGAEQALFDAGTSVSDLMEIAAGGAAEWIRRVAAGRAVTVLCGPGNNGGDGYVTARYLRERGVDVRVAALGEPRHGAAAAARAAWTGPIEPFDRAQPAPLLIDALFGTGLTRGLEASLAARLKQLAECALTKVAVDLPSGVETDTGACLGPVPEFDLTVTFATLKPAHRLFPAAGLCGRIATVDIGVEAQSALGELARPMLAAPGPSDHKYTRGMVAVVGGAMPGAGELSSVAALHAGAGYVLLLQREALPGTPHAIVRRGIAELVSTLKDGRVGAVVIGPGLGRGREAEWALHQAVASGRPLVIDGDALHLLPGKPLTSQAILTPHEGEFRAMMPDLDQPSKVERARVAAARTGAVIVYKGPDTIIAAPDGRAVIAAEASPWLSTAGTGDVLAGAIGAMLARGLSPFEAARAGVWLHGQAARRAGRGFTADDLAVRLAQSL